MTEPECRLMQGDCLDLMGSVPDGSIDLITADLPYGVTRNAWDVAIPWGPLWEHYRRVLTPTGTVILTGIMPFTATAVVSNLPWFRFACVWRKSMPTGFLNAKKRPLSDHEDIAVFSPGKHGKFTYNPRMKAGRMIQKGRRGSRQTGNYGAFTDDTKRSDQYYPRTVIEISNGHGNAQKHHPTEKPIALLAYLISTYSNPRDRVLDNVMGSGTAGVAAAMTGRAFVGIERDPAYFQTAKARIENAQRTADAAAG